MQAVWADKTRHVTCSADLVIATIAPPKNLCECRSTEAKVTGSLWIERGFDTLQSPLGEVYKMRLRPPIIAVIATAMLSACATTPPPVIERFDTSRAYGASRDVVWEKTVEWFATQNIPIKAIEKESGIISGEAAYLRTVQGEYAVCETPMMFTTNGANARLNILIRGTEQKATAQVNVTIVGEAIYAFSNPPQRQTVACQSTGRLENSILNYIGAPAK